MFLVRVWESGDRLTGSTRWGWVAGSGSHVPDHMVVLQVIEELLLMEAGSEQAKWVGLVVYLPL